VIPCSSRIHDGSSKLLQLRGIGMKTSTSGTWPYQAVAVDVETTGLSPACGHRVIEIAAAQISSAGLGETFHSLIDCGRKVSRGAEQVHGITEAMLAGQPAPGLAFERFRQFVGASDLVAHNAAFDRTFLRHEYGRLGWQLTNRMHCTLALSRRFLPDLADHRLETVFRYLFPGDAEAVRLHRAMDDAWAVGRIWLKMTRWRADLQDSPE
jgi:DNA polymerase III subunit epsilon